MSMYLKLELKDNNQVAVTNSRSHQQITVPLRFIQQQIGASVWGLLEYKYYELFSNTESVWQAVKSYKPKSNHPTFLKIQLLADNQVLVTNPQSQEKLTVPLRFLQQQVGASVWNLLEYKYYELFSNVKNVWQQIQSYNPELEAAKQMYYEQKFKEIMSGENWLALSDYDRQICSEALAWADTFRPKTSIDTKAVWAAGLGAASGAAASNAVGGIGVAMGGTAFGVGMIGLTALGTVAGIAAYGISRAFG